MDTITEKICTKCGELKPLSEYHRRGSTHTSHCKTCKLAVGRAHYRAHEEEIKIRAKAFRKENGERLRAEEKLQRAANPGARKEYKVNYYKENKENIAAYQREYLEENKEIVSAKKAEYYKANKEHINTRNKKYRENNPDKINSFTAARRSAKLQSTPIYANMELIEAFYREASRLTKETGIPHHVDHIIPLKGKLVSGLHVETNLQILTASENCAKNNHFDPIEFNNLLQSF